MHAERVTPPAPPPTIVLHLTLAEAQRLANYAYYKEVGSPSFPLSSALAEAGVRRNEDRLDGVRCPSFNFNGLEDL